MFMQGDCLLTISVGMFILVRLAGYCLFTSDCSVSLSVLSRSCFFSILLLTVSKSRFSFSFSCRLEVYRIPEEYSVLEHSLVHVHFTLCYECH